MKNEQALSFTGERLVPEIVEYWSLEHLHRYAIAMNFTAGKRVVDIASGEGYGTYLMSETAAAITGIDISEEAVVHARSRYTRGNLRFETGSATSMPVEDASIDVLTSFETIEHHDQHNEMMLEIRRVLKPNGILVISSPDKKYYSDIPGYKNPFHTKELYKDEFVKLVSSYFPFTAVLNQKSVVGSVVVPDVASSGFDEYSGDYDKINRATELESAVYTIIVASREPFSNESLSRTSVFTNQAMFDAYIKSKERYDHAAIQNSAILSSSSYRLGRLLTFPLRKLKIALSSKK